MVSWVLVVMLSQVPTNLSAPPLVPGPAIEMPAPVVTTTPRSARPTSALTVIGLSTLAVGMLAEFLDLLVSNPFGSLSTVMAVYSLIPLLGSGLVAVGTAGLNRPFTTRAFVYFGVQTLGAALGVVGAIQSIEPPAPKVSVVPVAGGAVMTLSVFGF